MHQHALKLGLHGKEGLLTPGPTRVKVDSVISKREERYILFLKLHCYRECVSATAQHLVLSFIAEMVCFGVVGVVGSRGSNLQSPSRESEGKDSHA